MERKKLLFGMSCFVVIILTHLPTDAFSQCTGIISRSWVNNVQGSYNWCTSQTMRRCPPGGLADIGGVDGFLIREYGRKRASELVVHPCSIPLNQALLNINVDLGPAFNAQLRQIAQLSLAKIEADLSRQCNILAACDQLVERDVSSLTSREREKMNSQCCPVSTPSYRERVQRAFDSRADKWTEACVIQRLCEYDPMIIRDLNEVRVKRVRGLVEHIAEFDGNDWEHRTIRRGGFEGDGITIDDYSSCDIAAQSFVHEVGHLRSANRGNLVSTETEARLRDTEYRNFIESGDRRLSRRQRQCIAYHVEKLETVDTEDPEEYAVSQRPGWDAHNYAERNGRFYTLWRKRDNPAEFVWQRSRRGDRLQTGTGGMSTSVVETSSWRCNQ